MDEYNAASRKSVRAAEKAARLTEAQRREVIAGIMSVPPGRAWVLSTLEAAHIFSSSFAPSPLAMAFAEGERNIGLQLLNDIMRACPDRYTEMMHERSAADAARDAARANAQRGDQGSDSDPAYGDEDGEGDEV